MLQIERRERYTVNLDAPCITLLLSRITSDHQTTEIPDKSSNQVSYYIEWQGSLMKRVLKVVVAGVVAAHFAQTSGAQALSEAAAKSAIDVSNTTAAVPPVPALPTGRSTALGGEIQDIDPVLDRFTLRIYGQKPTKVFFDARTQLFRDGKRVALRELHPSEHASVQTMLDGSKIFAVSIHLRSQSTSGDYEGRVLAFNPVSGELTIGSSAADRPLTITVPPNTNFSRKGQIAFASVQSGPADLQRGSLVSVTFDSDNRGHAVANQISVLATPGAQFVFGGDLTTIDIHAGLLALVDPSDEHSYQVHFNSASFPFTQTLRVGQKVRVAVEYDGTHYQARDISTY
jgi:hypothetical protein